MPGEFELAKGHLMPFAGGLLSVSIFASSLALVIMPEKKCLSKLGGASVTACSEGQVGTMTSKS